MAKNILILGGGFAGLWAARELAGLAKGNNHFDVTLINRVPYTTMVPSLPDLAGTRVNAKYLTEDIRKLISRDIHFSTETVLGIDLNSRTVTTDAREHPYDYLIIATGSVTNFFGFDQHLDQVHNLDYLEHGKRIAQEFPQYLARCDKPAALVVGGGYTGLELACNLRYCAAKRRKPCDISIIELKEAILAGMPDNIRTYMEDRCAERGLTLLTGRSVQSFDGANVELSDGTRLDDVFLCWSTGTKFGLDVHGSHETIRDGRIVVDGCLRIPQHPEVYAAGDAAAMDFGGGVLRKAVNFSLYSGRHAGINVARDASGNQPVPFAPRDLGWVIPFCNAGAGKLFSKFTVYGRFPLALHYFMCGYRNYNMVNRWHYLKMALAATTCRG